MMNEEMSKKILDKSNSELTKNNQLELKGITEAYRNGDVETKKKAKETLNKIYDSAYEHALSEKYGSPTPLISEDYFIPFDESWLVSEEEAVVMAAQSGINAGMNAILDEHDLDKRMSV